MFNDVFRPLPQQNVPQPSFTEGAEEPFEALDIDEIVPTDYGEFVLQALAVMKKGKQSVGQMAHTVPSKPASSPESRHPDPPSSAPSSQKKRKRGEEDLPLSRLSVPSTPSTMSTRQQSHPSPPSPLPTSIPISTPSSSSPPSTPPSGMSIDQDILRQSLRLASSFLLADSTLNPELGLETWATGLGRLVDIVLALHQIDALEVETMCVAATALHDCWVAGGTFPGLEASRIRIREDGQKLKKLLDDPNRKIYKGQRF
ncbi:hypothetical protein NMY22_g4586 [Coprinellus aureogranulatus]|nr:hypothetical protein NMY22_g4586 [Coprinellus aureogranulatus]